MTDPTPDTETTKGASAFPAIDPGQVKASPDLVTTTLAELGDVLPASRLSYRFHRPNMGTMKRLGQLQADNELQRRPGRFVTEYLAAALAELGGEDMGDVERDTKRAHRVASLPTGDVLTLLVAWTHRQHTRKGVKLGAGGCGACGAEWESIRVQLGELQVHAVPEDAEGQPTALVGLWDGFPLHGKQVSAVLVQAPTWGETLGGLSREAWGNPAAIRAATIQGAVKGTDAIPKVGRLGAESLDELMPDDLELLDQALGEITASVDLGLEVTCPACGVSNTTALDWRNLGFSSGPARV